MAQRVSADAPTSGKASLFDLRFILAFLFGVYGVILTVMGLLPQSADAMAKTGDWNVNLWVGIAMLVLGAVFVLWARLRPLTVGESVSESGSDG